MTTGEAAARDALRMPSRSDDGAPALLAMFVLGTLAVVGVVVALARLQDDWADAGAILLVVAIAALLGIAILRQLDDDD
jgi:hypothetical protein